MRNGHWMLGSVGTLAAMGMFGVLAAEGCRADTTSSGSGGNGGSSTTSTSTTSSGMGGGGGAGGQGGASSSTGGAGGGTGGSGGSAPTCDGKATTVQQVAGDPASMPVDPAAKPAVKLSGVIATSQPWLVSKSNATGSCLWGVFVAAPEVSGKEATAYSGALVLSYGTDAKVDPMTGKSYCPVLSVEPTGSAIPDDVLPGDELNVIGIVTEFLLNQCNDGMNDMTDNPTGNKIPQRQVSNACLVEKTGNKLPLPLAHVFTDMADVAKLRAATPDTADFHKMWASVRVAVQGPVDVVMQMNGMTPSVTNGFGEVILSGSNLAIGDKPYYIGFLAKTQPCHAGPVFTPPMMGNFSFNSISGMHYINFCTWGLQAQNKCTDYSPASEDCNAGMPNELMCP